jgi:hypothetical protein
MQLTDSELDTIMNDPTKLAMLEGLKQWAAEKSETGYQA